MIKSCVFQICFNVEMFYVVSTIWLRVIKNYLWRLLLLSENAWRAGTAMNRGKSLYITWLSHWALLTSKNFASWKLWCFPAEMICLPGTDCRWFFHRICLWIRRCDFVLIRLLARYTKSSSPIKLWGWVLYIEGVITVA